MIRKRFIAFLLAFTMAFSAVGTFTVFAASFKREVTPTSYNPLTDGDLKMDFNFEHGHITNVFIKTPQQAASHDDNQYVAVIASQKNYSGDYQSHIEYWDGKNDQGLVAPQGQYVVCIEVQEEEWIKYKYDIKLPFKVAYETSYSLKINPNLGGDEFVVEGNCDATFDNVELVFGGDVVQSGDPTLTDSMWKQSVIIADETTNGLALIQAYKILADGSKEPIGELQVIKHIVKAGEKLADIARKYYGDDPAGISTISDFNGISESQALNAGTRLLILNPVGYEDGFDDALASLKFGITLLKEGGIWSVKNGTTVLSVDPVNLATGNFLYTTKDLQIDGAFPLSFNRFYNVIDDYSGITGHNWHNDFDIRIIAMGDGSMAVVHEDGHWEEYRLDENANFTAQPGVYNVLEYSDGAYKLLFPDSSFYEFDEIGNIVSKTDLNGNRTDFAYEDGYLSSVSTLSGTLNFTFDNGLVSQIADHTGRSVSYEYDGTNLTGFTDVNGKLYSYSYDDEDRLLTITNPLSSTLVVNVYDDNSRATNQSFPDGGSMSYAYEEGLTTLTEQNGNIVKRYIDDKYRIYKEEYSDGTIEKDFDDAGNIVSYKDKNNNVWTYTHDANGNVLTETDPLGQITAYVYNELNKVKSITKTNGALNSFNFDSKGNLILSTDALGKSVTLNYNGQGLMTDSTDKRSITTTIAYDSKGNIASITDGAGKVTSYEYDSLNRVSKTILPEGNATSMTYTVSGKLSAVTDADSNTMSYTYDAADNLISTKDFNGNVTTYSYDEMNHLISSTDALGHSKSYEYDHMWNIVKITDENGNSVIYFYNLLNKLESSTDENGNVTYYHSDPNGNITETVDALNQSECVVYDALNRPVKNINKAENSSTIVYNSAGNIIESTDFMDVKTRYEYDLNNQLIKTIDALNQEISYEYDENGNVTAVTDTLGNTTKYEYNNINKVSATVDPMGGRTEMMYDGNGNVVQVKDPEGNISKLAYDELDRLSTFTDAENGIVVYSYDTNGNMTVTKDARNNEKKTGYDALNRAVSSTDESGFVSVINYDPEGLVSSTKNARKAQTSFEYDANGNVTTLTDALDNITRFEFDALNRLTKVTDARGNATSYTYKPTDEVETITDALNGATRYEYDDMGRVVKASTPMEFDTVSEYDIIGRLKKTTDPEGNVTEYGYDKMGRITETKNADGTFVKYAYNANGWLTDVWNEDGAVVSYAYDKNGNVLKTTDAKGYTTSYTYDRLSRTTSMTDALGGVTNYEYDANGNLLESADALNQTTKYVYNEKNLVINTTDPNGNVTAFEYDENGNIVKATNPDGGVTTFAYDLLDRLVSYTDGEGYTFSQEYDANGNVIESTDGRGNSKSMVFDALNRLTAMTDENGFASQTVYDADGRVTSYTNNEGAVTSYEYDKNSNIVKATDALGNATTFTYDSMNRVKTMTNARGAVTSYEYTPTGKVAKTTDALNGVKTYEYDILGRLVKETNELSSITEYTYDALGQVLSVKNPLGNSDRFTYDAVGRIKTVTDKNGNVTKYNYDANGNIIETIDALGHSSTFAYDAMNRLNKVTLYRIDGQDTVNEQQITLYSYDKRGLVTKEITAAGDNTIYVYDGNGNLVQKTDADGYITNYGFDATNLVEAINYADGKEAQFAYNKNGELVAMMDWNGTVNFTLDLLGRITKVNDQNEKITSYTYDSVGNQTTIKYPDNTVAIYTYDLLNRMTNLKDAENQNTIYAFDAASQLISQAYPNGWNETKEYDAAGQLLRQYSEHPDTKTNHSIEHTYSYDPQGNILKEYRSGAGGQDRFNLVHTYDALNRLTSTIGDQGYKNHEYTYDSLGNLTYEKIANSKSTDYKYNNLNEQVKKIVDGKDTYNYTFDKRGNLVKGVYAKNNSVTEQYVYDASNRMVKGTNDAGEQSFYIYDGLGNLVGNEWVIKKNAYGYTNQSTSPSEQVGGVVVCDRHKNTTGNGHINPTGKGHTTGGTTGGATPVIDGKKFQVVHKDYVLDYTSPLKNVIMETESGVGALTYRNVYGLDKVETVIYGIPNGAGSVMQYVYDDLTGELVLTTTDPGKEVIKNNIVKLYSHQDHLGTTDYLTDNVKGKVESYVTYDDWGALTAKAILKMGVRELDLVQNYTGHSADMVLGVFYAKARMYDAQDRRFMAIDPVRGIVTNPQSINAYAYVLNNPINYVDPDGETPLPAQVIGRVYTIEGVLNGQPVWYVGSTSQEVAARFSKHTWKSLINAPTTTITSVEVTASLDVAASGQGTLRSATNEALRSAEQPVIEQMKAANKGTMLNKSAAATPEHQSSWKKTHDVKVNTQSKSLSIVNGVATGLFVGMTVLWAYDMYLEGKKAEYIWSPYLLEDQGGIFTIGYYQENWWTGMKYFKTYQSDDRKEYIEKDDFYHWKAEAHALWGYMDWKGDFVPGILRPELPVIEVPYCPYCTPEFSLPGVRLNCPTHPTIV